MKKLVMFGGLSLILGLILLFLTYLMTGGNWTGIIGKTVLKQAEFSAAEVKSLDVNVSLGDVDIIGTDQDKVTVDYAQNSKVQYEVTQNNGRLSVQTKSSGFVIADLSGLFEILEERKPITIKLPKGQLEKLDANVGGGQLTLKDLEIKGDSVLKTGMGELTAENTDFQGKMTGESNAGELVLSDLKAQTMDLSSDMGSIELDNIQAADGLTADANAGEVKFEHLDVGRQVKLSTDMGSVSGSLVGSVNDYNITSQADMGDNNLPNRTTSGSKTLQVDTNAGSIDIQFTED